MSKQPSISSTSSTSNQERYEPISRVIDTTTGLMLTSNTSETSRKLFKVIERGSKLHHFLRNEIDVRIRLFLKNLAMDRNGTEHSIEQQSLEQLAAEIENCITLYNKKCRPIIEETCPFPAPVLERCANILDNHGDESWMVVREYEGGLRYVREPATIINFMEQMKEETLGLLGHLFYTDIDTDEVHGRCFDYSIDTPQQVRNIVEHYPESLEEYPRIFLCESAQAIAFIPLIAQIAIEQEVPGAEANRGWLLTKAKVDATKEFVMIAENQRGELGYYNTLQYLAMVGNDDNVDRRAVDVYQELKEADLMKAEDIKKCILLYLICSDPSHKTHFPAKRFWFLVSWDLKVLCNMDITGRMPLYYAARNSTMEGFKLVFKLGMMLSSFRKEIELMDLLFLTDCDGITPFMQACERHGQETVLTAIEDSLMENAAYADGKKLYPYDAMRAILHAAPIDVHLDFYYFVLRIEPNLINSWQSHRSIHPKSVSGRRDGERSNGEDLT